MNGTYPHTTQPDKPGHAANCIQHSKLQGNMAPVCLGYETVECLLLQVVGVVKGSLLGPQHLSGTDSFAAQNVVKKSDIR